MNMLVRCLTCGKKSARVMIINGVLSSYCLDCGVTTPIERVSLSTTDSNRGNSREVVDTGHQKEGL